MNGSRRLSILVGSFVMASLAVLSVMLFLLSAERGFLRPRYRLVTYFENVQGLTAGAPVRLAGRDVGFVEFVNFAPLGMERPPVRVVLQIDENIQERVRSDSVASIGTIGLLGDKYVEISMGTAMGRVLGDGDDLPSVSPVDLNEALERGGEAVRNIAELTANVNEVVESFRRSVGGEGLAEIANSVGEVAREIREGDGLLHGLIYGSERSDVVRSAERSLSALERVILEIESGDGPLHGLIYGPASGPDVVERFSTAAASLDDVLGKIDRGEGTLGLLVNDPTLYEDLKVLVGGAQRSLVVRSLIRLSGDE
jgi:phospholipid/cholesterol/gamma-HCH transport system substrate-binding protein